MLHTLYSALFCSCQRVRAVRVGIELECFNVYIILHIVRGRSASPRGAEAAPSRRSLSKARSLAEKVSDEVFIGVFRNAYRFFKNRVGVVGSAALAWRGKRAGSIGRGPIWRATSCKRESPRGVSLPIPICQITRYTYSYNE